MFSISNSTTDFFVVKRAFPPTQNLRQFRCQPLTALPFQFLRHAVKHLGDAAGDGGKGVAVTAEGYRRAQRVLKIAALPKTAQFPGSSLHDGISPIARICSAISWAQSARRTSRKNSPQSADSSRRRNAELRNLTACLNGSMRIISPAKSMIAALKSCPPIMKMSKQI